MRRKSFYGEIRKANDGAQKGNLDPEREEGFNQGLEFAVFERRLIDKFLQRRPLL